jgi:hypothetical protein
LKATYATFGEIYGILDLLNSKNVSWYNFAFYFAKACSEVISVKMDEMEKIALEIVRLFL